MLRTTSAMFERLEVAAPAAAVLKEGDQLFGGRCWGEARFGRTD